MQDVERIVTDKITVVFDEYGQIQVRLCGGGPLLEYYDIQVGEDRREEHIPDNFGYVHVREIYTFYVDLRLRSDYEPERYVTEEMLIIRNDPSDIPAV